MAVNLTVQDVIAPRDAAKGTDQTNPYDANGNMTTIQDFVASETLNYSYDVLDRLTGVSGAYSQSYDYNATTGNLENKAGQTLAYADINHPHAATGMGSNAYSYDENGSMVSRQISSGTYILSYDAGGQLVGISGGGMSAAYTYNGDGERVKVDITMSGDTKTSAYIGDYFEVSVGDPIQAQTVTPPNCSISICLYLPLVMTASRAIPSGHAWTSYYSVNGRRVAMRVQSNQDGVAEGVYYFLGDHLGSTTVTLDYSGNLVGELRYSAWGETRYTSGTTPTQRRYTGQLQAEAGLYFYNARWFDGSLGRFVQADSIIPQMANVQSWDRYAYTLNSPLMYTDPSGHWVCGDYYDNGCIETDAEYFWFAAMARESDAAFLVDLYTTDQLTGTTAQERTEAILKITKEISYQHFKGNFGDTGFKSEYRDGHDQIGHLLTAIDIGLRNNNVFRKYPLDSIVIGHEMIGDDTSSSYIITTLLQIAAGYFSPWAHIAFYRGTTISDQMIMLPGQIIGRSAGNSRADLQLTRLGFEFSALLIDNSFATLDEVSTWLQSNLCQYPNCSQ